MSFLDKLLGRTKDAEAEAKDDTAPKREEMHQEAEGAGEASGHQAEDMAQEARAEGTERHDPT